jgi:hypothetical protein
MYIPLEPGEEIVLKVHRHWLYIAIQVFVLAFLAVIPFIVTHFLVRFSIVDVGSLTVGTRLALWSLWLLILWALFWQFWTTYYMDVWIVTNRRIIDIDYLRLFDRNISIIHLDRVQDITTHVQGILQTLLKFGSVRIQSAGADREFVIDQISHPEALRDTISRVVSERTAPRDSRAHP